MMLRFSLSSAIAITAATLLLVTCSALSTRYATSSLPVNRFRLYAGFGQPVSKPDKQSGPDKLVNPQLKSMKDEAICPCCSGLTYKACCKVLHDGGDHLGSFPNPEMLTRARYSSFAVGSASYIIDTTDSSHRDYKKHVGSNLDPKRARKAWEKEIITMNSEVFDFLKLELLEGDEKMLQKQNQTLADGQESVAFRILVRKRSDGSLITFQESSVYVPMPAGYVPLGSKPLSGGMGKGKSSGSKSGPTEGKGWLYSYGIVTPVEEKIAKRIMGEAPQFLNNLSIRDRW